MDRAELSTFIQLVETLSFTKTAALQNTTQATISRRIKELEKSLCLHLVKRDTRNLTITDAGYKLYNGIKKQEDEFNELINELQNDNKQIRGTIKVSLPHAVAYEYISPHIGNFLRENPKINLQVIYQNYDINLVNERIDLAVIANLPKQQTTIIKLLGKFTLQLYCSPKYIERYGEPKSLDELENHIATGWITHDFTMHKNIRAINLKTNEECIIENRKRLMIDSALHSKQIAINGEVIIGSWDCVVKDELIKGNLVKILPDFSFGEIPYYLIRLPNSNSARIDSFIKFLADCFNKIGNINQ